MKIRCAIFCLAAIVGLVLARGPAVVAQAEKEPASFKNVRLWINPEYDRPELLVMLEGQVVGIEAPATVRFLVPATAEMYSAGSMDAQGTYSGGPPNRERSKIPGWDEISYTVKTNTFRVEYYDAIVRGQPDKTVSYDFHTLYPISDLRVMAHEPLKSSDYAISPRALTVTTDREGFKTHFFDYRDVATDKPLHFDISYTKSDPKPSLSQGSAAGSSLVGPLVVIGMAAAVVLVWVITRRLRPKYVSRQVSRAHQRRTPPAQPRRGGGRFCAGCGRPVEAGARFCRHCGNRLGQTR